MNCRNKWLSTRPNDQFTTLRFSGTEGFRADRNVRAVYDFFELIAAAEGPAINFAHSFSADDPFQIFAVFEGKWRNGYQLIRQSEEYRTKPLEKTDTDPLVKRWLTEDAETAKSAGCVVAMNSEAGSVPWDDKASFAKVEFKTLRSPEKMPRYGQNLGLKGEEIKEFGDITRKSIQGMAVKNLPEGYEISFTNWKPMESTIINGVENLYMSYDEDIRIRGQKKLTLHVERWTFFNRDRVHTLIVSWNTRDNALWLKDETNLTNIVNTLNITPSSAK